MSSTSTPIPPKPVFVFALHALLLSLLLGYWPTPRALYPEALQAQIRIVFGGADSPIVFRAVESARRGEVTDTYIEAVVDERAEPIWRVTFSAVRMGYWPSAVLVAMLLATPMTARRRLLALGVGLAWIDVVAISRIGVEILRASEEFLVHEASFESQSLVVLRSASEVLNSNIVVIATVFLGWVAVAAPRRGLDVDGLLRLLRPGAPPTP